MKQFSARGSKTSSIPLKNPEKVRGEEAGGVEGHPGTRGGGEGAEGEGTKWAEGGNRFEDEGGAEVQHQQRT